MILEAGYEGFTMFELGKVGIFIAIAGILYLFAFSNKLLPDSRTDTVSEDGEDENPGNFHRVEAVLGARFPGAMVFQTEKAIQDVGDKLDAADKAAVEADVQALKDILAKSAPEETSEAQVAEIKAAKEKLMESAQKLFTKMYEQNAAAGAQAGPTPGAGPAPESSANDDVVDGDYKEV